MMQIIGMRMAALAAGLTVALAAWAGVPPAVDRVPEDVPIVVGVGNIQTLAEGVRRVVGAFGGREQEDSPLGVLLALVDTPGLQARGSLAVAVRPPAEEFDEPTVVLVVPVTDFAAFVRGLGGQPGLGACEIQLGGETAYAKNVGGGFAAVSTDVETLDAFEVRPGSGPALESLMGRTGRAVAEASDLFVVVKAASLRPALKQMTDQVAMGIQMAAAMGGGPGEEMPDVAQTLGKIIDAMDLAVLGLRLGEEALKADAAVRFQPGSEYADWFRTGGSAASLLERVPDHPFLVVAGIDLSSPAMRRLVESMSQFGGVGEEAMEGLDPLASLEKVDRMAFVMGLPPSIMDGLMRRSAVFVETRDPAHYITAVRQASERINGKTVQGITYTTRYEPGGAQAGGRAVDVWTVKMDVSPDNPAAAGMAQMSAMMFGAGPMAGYIAPVSGGVVMTYSRNSALFERMAAAAGGEGTLATHAGVRAVAAQFPHDHTAHVLLGTSSILEMAATFGAPGVAEAPEDLPPVGLALGSGEGAVRGTLVIPWSVIEAVGKMAEAMEGGREDEPQEEPAGMPGGRPRF